MNGPFHIIRRKGASAVEFAVVLPIIVLLLLGSVEFGRALMVQHALQEAAQAGCRIYTVKDATQDQASEIIDTAMANAKIKDYAIEFNPPTKSEVDEHMEDVSVKVTAEYDDIAWVTGWFMPGATIAGNCTMPADMEVIPEDDDDGSSDPPPPDEDDSQDDDDDSGHDDDDSGHDDDDDSHGNHDDDDDNHGNHDDDDDGHGNNGNNGNHGNGNNGNGNNGNGNNGNNGNHNGHHDDDH